MATPDSPVGALVVLGTRTSYPLPANKGNNKYSRKQPARGNQGIEPYILRTGNSQPEEIKVLSLAFIEQGIASQRKTRN